MITPIGEATHFTRRAMVGMCLSFLIIGALQASYGPAIPAMRERYDISASEVGLALSVHFLGALLGVLGTPALRHRMTNRTFLILALLTMVLGSCGFALAPQWWVALVAAFVIGLGFGWIDVGVNEFFLEFYGQNSTGTLNLLHANFGIGAILTPLLIGALPGALYPWVFVLCAVLSLMVLGTVSGMSGQSMSSGSIGRAQRMAAWPLVVLFMVFFAVHVGVESGIGGWETSHLISLGWASGLAAAATSGFWLAMTAARFAVPFVARYLNPQQILLSSIVTMMVGTLLAHWGSVAVVGYVIAGVGVGPLFPTGLVWLSQKLPGVRGVTSLVVAASMIGGVFPSVLGGLVELWGERIIPTALTVICALCLLLALFIRSRRPSAPLS